MHFYCMQIKIYDAKMHRQFMLTMLTTKTKQKSARDVHSRLTEKAAFLVNTIHHKYISVTEYS